MAKQWHPLFAHLLGLLLGEHYEIQTEVPVSDLPRRGDILLLRRQAADPPFRGLWEHLTEWNVLEFKGPSDDAEGKDLELLVHVGSGLSYRLNEERQRGGEPLAPRQVSFWYLAPTLGETFLKEARSRAAFDYQTGGLWRGRVWGHPVWLLAYRDAPVEVDTIPLHLLDRDPPAPRSLGELVVQQQHWLVRFAAWLSSLQPQLWKEIRLMASTSGEKISLEWDKIAEFADLREVVRLLPPEEVVQVIGLDRLVSVIGLDRLVSAIGPEKLLSELLRSIPETELQGMLRRQQKKE
jgi:hypothetical protein